MAWQEEWMTLEDYKRYLMTRPADELRAEIAEHFIQKMELDPAGVFASDFRSFVMEGQVEDFIEDFARTREGEGSLKDDAGFVEFLREIKV